MLRLYFRRAIHFSEVDRVLNIESNKIWSIDGEVMR